MDDMAEGFEMLTPYQYAGNNPVSNKELDGLEPLPIPGVVNSFGEGYLQAKEKVAGTLTDRDYKIANDVDNAANSGTVKGAKLLIEAAVSVVAPEVGIPLMVTDLTGAPALPSPAAFLTPAIPEAEEALTITPTEAVGEVNTIEVSTGEKTFQTYTKEHPTEGTYSGRTSGTGTREENVAARDDNHHMNDKGYGPAQLDKSSSNSDAIRGREQQLIDANGGAKSTNGTSGNAINGISTKNPKKKQYIDAANKEFGN